MMALFLTSAVVLPVWLIVLAAALVFVAWVTCFVSVWLAMRLVRGGGHVLRMPAAVRLDEAVAASQLRQFQQSQGLGGLGPEDEGQVLP